MRVIGYETAVAQLNCAIELTEVRVRASRVQRFFGHLGKVLLMWDDSGRAFSRDIEGTELEEDPAYLSAGRLPEDCYVRDAAFDLKFE